MSYNIRYLQGRDLSTEDGNELHEKKFLIRGSSRDTDGTARHHPNIYHHHQHSSTHNPALSRTPLGLKNDSATEKPLLGSNPVKLTPSWEEKNLTSDELNFKNVTLDEDGTYPPKDRFNFVYLILLLHGVGTLMPWNMFITAKSYFESYKLGSDDEMVKKYSKNFMLYITMAAQVPNLFFNFVNVFMRIGGSLTSRIVISILVEIVMFIVTVILAMVDSSSWPIIFFWLTIASVVLLNMANGIYQNSVYGIAGNLPMKYSNAVVLGSNISGTIVALIKITSTAMAPNARTAAIYYFITAIFVLLACFDTYFALPLSRFYRFYETKSEKQTKIAVTTNQRIPYWFIFKKALPQLWNVFFTFFVTLAIFPSLHSSIVKSDPYFVIPDKFYSDVMCFFVFNFFAMIGNLIPLICRISPRWLWLPVLFRIFLIPAFLFSNYQPMETIRVMPIVICNDWAHFGLGIALGLTGGYFSSLGMMYAPKTVESEHSPIAAMMAATSLIMGLFSGIVFSFLMPVIIENSNFTLPDSITCNVALLVPHNKTLT